MFFSNMSSWGPKAERFLQEKRRDFQIVGFLESHTTLPKYRTLCKRLESLGRRPFAAHATLTSRSEFGSSGGVLLMPLLQLQLAPFADYDEQKWKYVGDDWALIVVRAKHTSYIIMCAYLDHTVGATGRNVTKLKQMQHALLYFKLPFVIFSDWNMNPAELMACGFPESMFAEIVCAPNIASTCISGNTLDYLVVSRNYTAAMLSFSRFLGHHEGQTRAFNLIWLSLLDPSTFSR